MDPPVARTGVGRRPITSFLRVRRAASGVCADVFRHSERSPAVRALSSICVCALFVASAPPAASGADTPSDSNCPTTAAETLGWGNPNRADDFDDSASLGRWKLYQGPGNGGNGRVTPNALSFANGLLTITGDPDGNSEGMAWTPGQLYGRWEACVRSTPASPNYHSLLLLWPDSENSPAKGNVPNDGEIDFMEILDPARQSVTASVNHVPAGVAPDDPRYAGLHNFHAKVGIDATQWHSWAVEWTPDHVAGYVDGRPWFEATDHIPPNSMHLCIQLDNFGGDISAGGQEVVDWVRQYPAS
jgi:hypothetical protein